MKKNKSNSTIPKTESLMDFFPMPRTIPGGWDLSNMLTTTKTGDKQPTETLTTKETGSVKWANH
jgi:hypothetical protein